MNNKDDRKENLTNSWGVPDWTDATSYGDVDSWSNSRWRWEFLRRREDLREFFDRWATITHQQNLEENNGRFPNDPGFVAYEADAQVTRAWEKFGLVGIPNPRIGDQPDCVIRRRAHPLNPDDYKDGRTRHGRGRSVVAAIQEYEVGIYNISLAPNELAFKFDLDSPLSHQVENVRSELKRKQKEYHRKLLQRRSHPTKWLGYLRTLDARDADASWAQIAALHPNTAQTAQTARDIWEQARSLCSNF